MLFRSRSLLGTFGNRPSGGSSRLPPFRWSSWVCARLKVQNRNPRRTPFLGSKEDRFWSNISEIPLSSEEMFGPWVSPSSQQSLYRRIEGFSHFRVHIHDDDPISSRANASGSRQGSSANGAGGREILPILPTLSAKLIGHGSEFDGLGRLGCPGSRD